MSFSQILCLVNAERGYPFLLLQHGFKYSEKPAVYQRVDIQFLLQSLLVWLYILPFTFVFPDTWWASKWWQQQAKVRQGWSEFLFLNCVIMFFMLCCCDTILVFATKINMHYWLWPFIALKPKEANLLNVCGLQFCNFKIYSKIAESCVKRDGLFCTLGEDVWQPFLRLLH